MQQYIGKIINSDSAAFLKTLPDNCIDLTITSPPYDDMRTYGKQESDWTVDVFKTIANELFRITKQGGMVTWVVADKVKDYNKSLTSFRQALYFQEIGFKVYDVLIYEKNSGGMPNKTRYNSTYEFMFILSKGKPKTINLIKDKPNKWAGVTAWGTNSVRDKDGVLTQRDKKPVAEFGVRNTIWRYNVGFGFTTKDKMAYKHPAMFPEKLAEDNIISWSNEGDIVLDCFGGSGTVAKMADKLNRKWILVERNLEYCEIAKERLDAHGIETEIETICVN